MRRAWPTGLFRGAGVALPLIRGGGSPHPESFLRVSDRYHYLVPRSALATSASASFATGRVTELCLSFEVRVCGDPRRTRRHSRPIAGRRRCAPCASPPSMTAAAHHSGRRHQQSRPAEPARVFYLNVHPPGRGAAQPIGRWRHAANQLVRTGLHELYQQMIDNKERSRSSAIRRETARGERYRNRHPRR